MAEAVAEVVRLERAVEEEDAGGQRVREIVLRRVEDALAVRAEAAEGDAEGEAQMIGGRLGIVLGFVGRERCAFGAIDGGSGPSLARGAKAEGPGRRNSTEGSRWDSCIGKRMPRSELCSDCVGFVHRT